jgi:hypothetical protein
MTFEELCKFHTSGESRRGDDAPIHLFVLQYDRRSWKSTLLIVGSHNGYLLTFLCKCDIENPIDTFLFLL